MLDIIVISVLALIAAAYAVYLWQRAPGRENSSLPAPRNISLFNDRDVESIAPGVCVDASFQAELITRARGGDLDTLDAAQSGADANLYDHVLNALIDWSESQERLLALVSHISNGKDFRANRRLAEHLIETWKAAPNRCLTTAMMHIAALSNDPATYQRAVEHAIDYRRRGLLGEFSDEELFELAVSQFWLIAPEARCGGEGFALKRKLSGLRRDLAAGQRVKVTPPSFPRQKRGES